MRNLLTKNIIVFCLFLSSAFSITYWAIAKYDVYKDYKACGDAQEYIKMSKHDYSDVQRRYRYRIIMPYLVSLLDKNLKISSFLSNYYEDVDNKMVQLNFGIINIFSLALTAYVLFYYCRAMGFSQWEGLTGGFLFLTSFFVVNYYTAPMVDSLSSLFIIWGFYSVLTNSLPGLFISFSLGVFTKETMFVIPLLILLTERRVVSKKILACVPATIAYIIFVLSLSSSFSRTDTYVFRSLIDC
jgi:hypothetical protein